MELIKSIVDSDGKLVGFVAEGKDSEFGGILQDKVQKCLSIAEMVQRQVYTKQLAVDPKTNRLVPRGKFQISDIPMCMVSPNGGLVDIDNRIKLVGKFVKDGTIIGFKVMFGSGAVKQLLYKDVLTISKWYKPMNFTIRIGENGRAFIAGKANVLRLEELPTTDLSVDTKPTKRTKPAVVQATSQIDPNCIPERSIMDIFDCLGDLGGFAIKLPDEKYKPTKTPSKGVAEGFIPLGIGEVAAPKLSYSNSKLTANLNFKKLGKVGVQTEGREMAVDCYTIATKSVFFNGEAYIKRLGVALPEGKASEFFNHFGDTLGVTEITQDHITQPIRAIQGDRTLKLFEIDTNRLSIISKRKVDESVLTPEQIREIVVSSFTPRLICKYLSPRTGLIAEIKKEIPKGAMPGNRPDVAGYLSQYNSSFLEEIEKAGVDTQTGLFKRTVGIPKDKDVSGSEDIAITIEYNVDGYNVSKITYKNIKEWLVSNQEKLPKRLVEIGTKLESFGSPVQKLEAAEKLFAEYSELVERYNYTMWLHRCSMYLKSNKMGVHSQDKSYWEIDLKRRSKAKIYRCTKPGCEDLAVALVNIDII